MELSVQEVVRGLLAPEALDAPSDSVKPEELDLELPKWFDEKKFNTGRRFYKDNCFGLSTSMMQGLLAVLAVPSILRVLVGSRRSSSLYTSYKRYLATILHTNSWFEHELRPGTTSWKSLLAVRSRHLRAGLAGKLQGNGVISQRDIALAQFGFMGFVMIKPDKFGVRPLQEGDWEAYNHVWSVVGYMLGLEDRYNICRRTVEETREVCQIILERVYTPCLDNVPEHFEYMARTMLESISFINPTINVEAALYNCKHLAEVPGYIYSEDDRQQLLKRIRKQLNGKPEDTGVDSSTIIEPAAVAGLPARAPRLLRLRDYATVNSAPEYSRLDFWAKYKVNLNALVFWLHSTYLGRLYFKLCFQWRVILMKYCPYLAFFEFGLRASFVNIFKESPTDDTKPKPNSEYNKPKPQEPWYKIVLNAFW